MAEEILKTEEVASEGAETTENIMETIIHDPNTPIVSIKKLLEAGAHYGHPTKKWNPKMKPYIYTSRNGIYIIDLAKTKEGIEVAYEKLKEIVSEGGKVLFVGTKDNAKEVIQEEAVRSGSFFVNNRWLGGILTNFKTIQTRIRKLKEMETQEENGEWDSLPKKDASRIRKEKEKLFKNLEGIKEMRKIPNALVVVDPMAEHNAVLEANKLHIPVFAICDTNCNPDNVDYIIPANDDTDKSVGIVISILADAVVEAKGGLPDVAFLKETDEDFTMKDVLRQVDRENALRLAARREMQRERLEKEKARRAAYESKKEAAAAATTQEATTEAPKAEETTPVVEEAPKAEETTTEKPKRTRKTTKKAAPKAEETASTEEAK